LVFWICSEFFLLQAFIAKAMVPIMPASSPDTIIYTTFCQEFSIVGKESQDLSLAGFSRAALPEAAEIEEKSIKYAGG